MKHETEEFSMGQHLGHHSTDGVSHHLANSDSSMHMMKMYFHFGLGDEFLFSGLILDTRLKLSLACLGLFLVSILVEALSYLRSLRCECELSLFHSKVGSHRQRQHSGCGNQLNAGREQSRTALCCSGGQSRGSHCELALFRQERRSFRLAKSMVQFARVGLAFGLMLAVMTYNVCLIFAVVAGE